MPSAGSGNAADEARPGASDEKLVGASVEDRVAIEKARALQEFHAYLKGRPDADDRKDVEREIEDLGG